MNRVLPVFVSLTLGGVAIAVAAGASQPSLRAELLAVPIDARLGGDLSMPLTDRDAFSQHVMNLSAIEERVFFGGKNLFDTPWTPGPGGPSGFGGLGPTFNRAACDDCHPRAGRGQPPTGPGSKVDDMLVRLSAADGSPHPAYGDQLQDRAIIGVPAEGKAVANYEEVPGTYGDGTPYTLLRPHVTFKDLAFGTLDGALVSARMGQPVFGLGLLEGVPEATLRALEDAEDADGDGISGRIAWVIDDHGDAAIGRFGWKAMHANLVDQAGAASIGDIGLTTDRQNMNCPTVQALCAEAQRGQPIEMNDNALERVATYQRLTAVPEARGLDQPVVKRGELVFRSFGCAECHMPTLRTGVYTPLIASVDDRYRLSQLSNQTFHPFTDLLLHDMGEGLADHRPEGAASGTEWRTEPLWGIGLQVTVNQHDRMLHDGRARGIAEAILWHGGEAEAAREKFRTAPAEARAALIAFLNAL